MLPKVIYYDYDHTYRSDDELLESITNFIGKFSSLFDLEYWSSYKAYEALVDSNIFTRYKKRYTFMSPLLLEILHFRVNPAEFRRKKRQIIIEWSNKNNERCKHGTKYHHEMEVLSILKGVELNPFTKKLHKVHVRKELNGYDNYSLLNDLSKLKDGYYPELLIWNSKYGKAGQADKVFIETIGSTRFVDIDDYKTNAKDSFHDFSAYMRPPIQDMPDSKFKVYSLQLSFMPGC